MPASATVTEAERCVLIDLPRERRSELFPALSAFASTHDLEPDLSHPIQLRYFRSRLDRSRAEVHYVFGMGEIGAVLTLYRFDANQDGDLLDAFDQFVTSEVKTAYRVTECSDVPDMQTPVAVRSPTVG